MVAPVHFDPKIWQGQETSYFIASVVMWKEIALDVGGPSSIYFVYFWGRIISSEAAMGRRGRAAPCLVWQ
jgi:hypothetical protein